MGAIREVSESLLSGALNPEECPPMVPRFEREEVAPGVHFVSAFANVVAFETGDGLVMVDVGSFLFSERTREVLRSDVKAPLHSAIYTHGHVDHCFGVEHYEAEPAAKPVQIVAHSAVKKRFDRYKLTRGYNTHINQRQFQVGHEFPGEFREPSVTFEESLEFSVGGRTFQLRHSLGETDDHAWVWEPQSKVLCTGDLFIWASPNCGNPQKAQRYPRLTLSGSVGALRVSSMGRETNLDTWSFGPLAVTLPLFDGGQRKANVVSAEAAYAQSVSVYRGKVRQAVREVEEALVNLQSTDARKQDAAVATAGYAESLAATQARYGQGLASLVELEDARRNALAAESAQLSLGLERNRAWVSLYRALGGGFEPDRLNADATSSAADQPRP